jgi:hypothetical protein
VDLVDEVMLDQLLHELDAARMSPSSCSFSLLTFPANSPVMLECSSRSSCPKCSAMRLAHVHALPRGSTLALMAARRRKEDGTSSPGKARTTRRRKAVEAGSKTTAGVAGAGTGLAATAAFGPLGAFLGPFATTGVERLFTTLGVDRLFVTTAERFAQRQLDQAGRQRLIAAYESALKGIAERLTNGEGIRNDGFFDQPRADGRTSAEELLEGLLQKAQDAYEQRKAERLGRLFAFVACDQEITPAHANYLLELADRLTYQQMLFLGFLSMKGEARQKGLTDWDPNGAFTATEIGVVAAILELAAEGLVVRTDNKRIESFVDINPRRLRTAMSGTLLCDAMDLEHADPEGIEEVTQALARLGKIDADIRSNEDDPIQLRVDVVVPPGSPPETRRVKIDKQAVRIPKRMLHLPEDERRDDTS